MTVLLEIGRGAELTERVSCLERMGGRDEREGFEVCVESLEGALEGNDVGFFETDTRKQGF